MTRRWINYQNADDAALEIGRPVIVPGARRHRARASTSAPSRAAPVASYLVARKIDGRIEHRCKTYQEALQTRQRLDATGIPHFIKKLTVGPDGVGPDGKT